MSRPGSTSHRIVDVGLAEIRVSARTLWRHVRLTTASGLTGLGEATLEDADPDFGQRLHAGASQLLGREPTKDALNPFRQLSLDLADRTALSALDQAVSDLQGQIAGEPLCILLGAETADMCLPLYANINRATRERTPEAFARNAKAAADEGYAAIKVAPFDDLNPRLCDGNDGQALIDAGLARIRAASDAAPNCALMVDCHWRLNFRTALELLSPLREIGVSWLECPLPETDETIPSLREIRQETNRYGMRLCGLELAGDWSDVRPFVEAGVYDVIMPDVKHAGGLEGILDIARRAKSLGTSVSLHNPSGPVAHLCSAHVMAAIDSGERMEIQWNESPLFSQVTDPAPVIEAGTCRPTSGPGLGVSLNDAAIGMGVSA